MLINLIDKKCAKIIVFLALSPGSNYRRNEIKEKTKLYNVPLDVSLNKLIVLDIIKEKSRIYSLNTDNLIVKQIIEERKEIQNIPLIVQYQLLDFIEKLIKFKNIKKIILFGSYSKFIFSDKSDIDIAIIFSDKIKNKSKIDKIISAIARKISMKYKKEIHSHLFLESDLKHKEDPLIKDILRNGRVLI